MGKWLFLVIGFARGIGAQPAKIDTSVHFDRDAIKLVNISYQMIGENIRKPKGQLILQPNSTLINSQTESHVITLTYIICDLFQLLN